MNENSMNNPKDDGNREREAPSEALLFMNGIAKATEQKSSKPNKALNIPEDFSTQIREMLISKKGRLFLPSINRRFFRATELPTEETTQLMDILMSMDFMRFDNEQGCFVATGELSVAHKDKFADMKPRRDTTWEEIDVFDKSNEHNPDLGRMIDEAFSKEDRVDHSQENIARGTRGSGRRRHRFPR